MPAASAIAAESNSLQPRVPASLVDRVISSLAPDCDGGSPSSLMTVASTTSSPFAIRLASSSSTLGTGAWPAQHGAKDLAPARDLVVGRRVAGGQAQAAQRLLERDAHREQHVRRVERSRRASRTARRR